MCLVSFSKSDKFSSRAKIDNFDGIPKWAYVDITSKCSHKCAWCYGGFNEDLTSEMSYDEFDDIMVKLKDIGLLQVTLSGGEPTEHPEFYRFVERASKDFMVHICSHGDWSTNHAPMLDKLGVTQIQFNYQGSKRHDGVHQVNGSYERQLQAIKWTSETNIETTGTVTVGAYNLNDVEIIFKELYDLGTDRLRVWESVGRGNAWRKGKEAKEIFERCRDAAAELGYQHIQSYDPEFLGDTHVSCPAMSEMLMYISSDSELLFCTATQQLMDIPIISFKENSSKNILNTYQKYMRTMAEHGNYCPARYGVQNGTFGLKPFEEIDTYTVSVDSLYNGKDKKLGLVSKIS
jgi:MoaA/NifB/PqqE/SkfB family radical SAM enzyme